MSNIHPLYVVDRGRKIHFEMGEKFNYSSPLRILALTIGLSSERES